MDNGSSHTSKLTKAWLEVHPRFVVHHTPVHASWLNQVEAFFSILTRKVLRRGEFDSREDLVKRMLAFIEHHAETAKPFKWVYDAKAA
jgi:transposase